MFSTHTTTGWSLRLNLTQHEKTHRRDSQIDSSFFVFIVAVYGVPSKVSLENAGTEQLYQAMRMIRGLGNVFYCTYSQTENGKDPVVTLVERLAQVITR